MGFHFHPLRSCLAAAFAATVALSFAAGASADGGGPLGYKSAAQSGGPPVLDARIVVSNTCRTTVNPPSYGVPAGGTFTVNWINEAHSEYPVDIDKIDRFNTVPLVIGLEPGQSWHDDIRAWCGEYTGTFSFRIRSACDQVYIPVDCNQ